MIQSTYETGLRVESIVPAPGDNNVSLYSQIKLTFNGDLSTATIINNFTILEDRDNLYTAPNSIVLNPNSFIPVSGNTTYKDRVVTFTPYVPFNIAKKYIVCIRANGIKDITGNTILAEQIFYFITEGASAEPKVDILTPPFGTVVENMPILSWSDVGSKAYVIEMSKSPTFENIDFTETITYDILHVQNTPVSYVPTVELDDGLYYLRIRAINGPWSDNIQFFIKRIQGALTSENDIEEFIQQFDNMEAPLELLEVYPKDGEAEITLNLGIIYFKFRGIVTLDDIDVINSLTEGRALDTDTTEDVNGAWNSVYDTKEDVSYIIYKLAEI